MIDGKAKLLLQRDAPVTIAHSKTPEEVRCQQLTSAGREIGAGRERAGHAR